MTEWDIQPGETAKAFHAFSHYRDMPPAERSIDAAYAGHMARCEGQQKGSKRAAGFWMRWSVSNAWVSRATAHDADLSPNPPKDTDGRREDSGRGWVRELQGRWPGVLGYMGGRRPVFSRRTGP